MDKRIVETARSDLILRRWAQDDKADLLRHADDRRVWRNLSSLFPHPYTEADADFWIAHANTPGTGLHLAIAFEGRAIGGIGIVPGEGVFCRTGQFGFWLGESFWGRGFATAAARAMAQHVFARREWARLEAPVIAWNPASMRVLENAGFTREGLLRRSVFKDGTLADSVLYALVDETAA